MKKFFQRLILTIIWIYSVILPIPVSAQTPTPFPPPPDTVVLTGCTDEPGDNSDNVFPYQTQGVFEPPSSTQPHYWFIYLDKVGVYEIFISPHNGQKFVNLDLEVYEESSCDSIPQRISWIQSASLISPSLVIKKTDPSPSLHYVLKITNPMGADFTGYGYSISLNFKPNPIGILDGKEDNQNESLAQDIGYSAQIDGLTIFNPNYSVDYDTFRIITTKALDMHCEAISSDSLLDLEIHPFLAGNENLPFPDSMGNILTDYFPNYSGVNPRVVFHSIQGNQDVYIKVYPSKTDASYLSQVGAISYSLKCSGGLGYPPAPPEPTNTPTPVPSFSGGGGWTYPTPTKQPLSNKFVASLLSSSKQQEISPNIAEFSVFTFSIYSDDNKNRELDLDEAVRGVKILIFDTINNKVIQVVETDAYGRVSITLQGEASKYRYIIPILNINRQLPRNSTNIKLVVDGFEISNLLP